MAVDGAQGRPPGTVVGVITVVAEATVIRDGRVVPPDEDKEAAR